MHIEMLKKDPSNTGGKVLLKEKGSEYFRKLAQKRWAKVKYAKRNKQKKIA